MECEKCQNAEATVHLTQVINGEVRKVHLCEGCAADSGVTSCIPTSISEILLGAGAKASQPLARTQGTCSHCGMERKEFKQHGRLGCDGCYDSFTEDLAPLLQAMHHSDRHTGKVPFHLERHLEVEREIMELQRLLKEAILDERFEEAAKLRDRIQLLSGEASSKGDAP